MKRHFEFVLIPSTLCNLRCRYCYELSHLADKRRADLDTLALVFERIRDYLRAREPDGVRFIWHGGEPLLIEPDFYWQALHRQAEALREIGAPVENSVQTNLTVIDDAREELLRDGFDRVGVSLDLFGSLRVNARGLPAEPRAIRNLDRLLARGLRLGGITVLTKSNLRRVADIYRFYRDRDMGFRLLPLHAGDFPAGQWFEIRPGDTLRALCLLADLWLSDDGATWVHPVVGLIKATYAWMTDGIAVPLYDRRSLLAIDREGFVYPAANTHQRDRSFGNILERPLSELLETARSRRILDETRARVQGVCGECPHYRTTCDGFAVAEGDADFWDLGPDGQWSCVVLRGLLDHLRTRLTEIGVPSSAGHASPHLDGELPAHALVRLAAARPSRQAGRIAPAETQIADVQSAAGHVRQILV